MLASAYESPKQEERTVEVVLPATPSTQSGSEESLSESLIDIEIPTTTLSTNVVGQERLPELVKRPPAMQLHIGGSTNRATTSSPTVAKSSSVQDTATKFRLAMSVPIP